MKRRSKTLSRLIEIGSLVSRVVAFIYFNVDSKVSVTIHLHPFNTGDRRLLEIGDWRLEIIIIQ